MKKKLILVLLPLFFFVSLPNSRAESVKVSGKNWKILLSGRTFFNDNVVHSPSNPSFVPVALRNKKSDWGFEVYGQASYKIHFSDAFKLDLDYSIDHTDYVDLSEYDLRTHTFGANFGYKIKPTWRINLRYMYFHNMLNGKAYSGLNYVSPSTLFRIHPKIGFTRINYSYKGEDNHQTSLRDTVSHSFGISQHIFFSKMKRKITIGYTYKNDDARGSIYDLSSHTFTAGIKTPLIWQINLKAQYQYVDVNYDTRVLSVNDPTIRNDNRHNGLVEISKVFLKNYGFLKSLTASLKYQRTSAYSLDKYFEYIQNIGTFTLKGKF